MSGLKEINSIEAVILPLSRHTTALNRLWKARIVAEIRPDIYFAIPHSEPTPEISGGCG